MEVCNWSALKYRLIYNFESTYIHRIDELERIYDASLIGKSRGDNDEREKMQIQAEKDTFKESIYLVKSLLYMSNLWERGESFINNLVEYIRCNTISKVNTISKNYEVIVTFLIYDTLRYEISKCREGAIGDILREVIEDFYKEFKKYGRYISKLESK